MTSPSCPNCEGRLTSVVDSRDGEEYVRRRRVCPCGHKFSTIEIVANLSVGLKMPIRKVVHIAETYSPHQVNRAMAVLRALDECE